MSLSNTEQMRQIVSAIFEIDSIKKIDPILSDLRDLGIKEPNDFNAAYCGCYTSEEAFCEDIVSERYREQLKEMPKMLEYCINWEAVWRRYERFDYTTIEHNYEYYFFRNDF